MRPVGDGGSARRVTPAGSNDARNKSTVQPLPTAWGGGGVTFTAVAEVHMSALVDDEEKLIAQANTLLITQIPGKLPRY